MKDQLEIIGKRLLKNIRIVAVVFFAALLAASFVLSSKESNFAEPVPDPPQPQPISNKFPSDNYTLLASSFVKQNTDISKDERLNRLVRVSMFDDKSVASEKEMEEAVRDDYQKAQQAFTDGKIDEALRLVESILQRNPTHRGSLEIKRKIEERKAAEAAAAAAAAQPTEGAPPAPPVAP